MDITDTTITFNDQGICPYCTHYDEFIEGFWGNEDRVAVQLATILDRIKTRGKNRDYDCVIGLSGGIDSSFVAYKTKELGLRPLAVHFDSGWNSETSVRNIENLVKKLDIDLYTYVCDWEEMRDLQLAYLKAGVLNADIPQDYAFLSAVYLVAAKNRINYFLSGYNYQTEFGFPPSWNYPPRDLKNLFSIQKQFGTMRLKKYPIVHPLKDFYYRFISIKRVDLLNYISYNKKDAIATLESQIGWRPYGYKHYESIWTRFYQGHYVYNKFGIDKRKAHFSSLIRSQQMTRDEAIKELANEPYSPELFRTDKEFVLKALRITDSEFEEIMASPIVDHKHYSNGQYWYEKLIWWLTSFKHLRSAYKFFFEDKSVPR